MKVALYARVSTNEQDATTQLKDLHEFNKWGEPKVFIENQSAWKDNKNRPEFDKVVALIKQRKLEHLIVWDLDRIYRNRQKLIEFFRLCKAFGCRVHSFRQAWLDSINTMPNPWNEIMFDLMLQVMGWIAEEESSKKSARVKKAVDKASGVTLSYKGNKWGRKGINKAKTTMLLACLARSPRPSIREIAKETQMAVGTVHKYIKEFEAQSEASNDSSAFSQLVNTKGVSDD